MLIVMVFVLLAAVFVCGGELATNAPNAPTGVMMLASLEQGVVMPALCLLLAAAVTGVVMVNAFDRDSETATAGGWILFGLVLLFVVFELVF
jgi:hypothetical protein